MRRTFFAVRVDLELAVELREDISDLIEVAPSAKLGEDDRSVAQPMRPAGSCHAEDVPLPKCVRLMRVAT
jgi:hypothetical protein